MRTSSFSKLYILCICLFSLAWAKPPEPVKGQHGMVVSSSKLSSLVGIEILEKGGNAIDAAVAVGFALAVTYPSAGNIGGGGFMVIHLNNGTNTTIDVRETAPLNAYRNMYLDKNNKFDPKLSSEGITSSGVPGTVAGLIYVLKKYGTLKLKDVIQPAIDLAENGFIIDYNLAESFAGVKDDLMRYPSSRKIFFKDNDSLYQEGDTFKQPELANTLKLIRDNGIYGFYKGKTADLLINQVKKDGGYITQKDLDNYYPKERTPVTGTYRGYDIISMPPPSAGGIALIEMLNILENYTFHKDEWGSSSYLHHLVESMKYAYADRTRYLGDNDFIKVPIEQLTSKKYAHDIFNKLTNIAVPSSEIHPGDFKSFHESDQTTHYSVCDNFGNAVSTTTTINSSFGNKIVVAGAGFLLNNEMDDFSGQPGAPNLYGLLGSDANSIQPGKRMLSSMTPVIVLNKDHKPWIIAGSPVGSTIITTVLQVLLNCIDFHMNIQEAVNAPRIHHQWYPDEIDYEKFGLTEDVQTNLVKMGYKIGDKRTLGRAECIMFSDNYFYGASDPRGYGSAEGY
ncbi:MAG: gamma-glutamyltransferase [Ignavibacteriaceae bacterium]|nr:gamma-glutamyltransferase [Ignavibacteriaceae bacterium]